MENFHITLNNSEKHHQHTQNGWVTLLVKGDLAYLVLPTRRK